jgi:uncharacterized protein involved in outer membrane biogenesis
MRRHSLLKPLAWALAFLLVGTGVAAWWVNQYQDDLFRRAQAFINDELNGTFEASRASVTIWSGTPGVILKLHDVCLRDRRFDAHGVELFRAREVRLRLNLRELVQQRVVISRITLADAQFRAFVGRDGYTNLAVFQNNRPTTQPDGGTDRSPFLQYLGRVHFENTQVVFADSLHQRYHAGLFQDTWLHLNSTDSSEVVQFEGKVRFDGLTFSTRKGPFLAQRATELDLRFAYHRARRELRVAPSTVAVGPDEAVQLGGWCWFPSGQPPRIDLTFQTQQMRLSRILPLLTPYLAERIGRYRFDTQIQTARVRLHGTTAAGTMPTVEARFETDTFTLQSQIGTLHRVRTAGGFTNRLQTDRPAADANSRLYFSRAEGDWEGLPFSVKLHVDDLTHPRADLLGQTALHLTDLNDLTEAGVYRFDDGQARVRYRFRGDLMQPVDSLTGRLNGTLRGDIQLVKGLFTYLPRRLELSDLHARASFDDTDLRLHEFRAAANQNPVRLTGVVHEFVPFLTLPRGKLYAAAELRSPRLNLNTLPTRRTNLPQHGTRTTPAARRQLQKKLTQVLARLELNLGLGIEHFQYRRLRAHAVRGRVVTTQRDLRIREWAMQAFGGTVELAGQLDYLNRQRNRLEVRCRIARADVQQVFRSFENFGQQTVTDRNLSGRLTAEATFQTDLTSEYRLLPATMTGDLRIHLADGVIHELAPLKRMQRFVFKRRDFSHVRFATIENQFRLRGQELEIDRMAIESSVLTLFVGGVYSFGTKTDLTVQIPFSNLRHRGSDYELVDVDSLRTRGLSVFVHAREVDGEMRLRYDFVRHRKPREKERERRRIRRQERLEAASERAVSPVPAAESPDAP